MRTPENLFSDRLLGILNDGRDLYRLAAAQAGEIEYMNLASRPYSIQRLFVRLGELQLHQQIRRDADEIERAPPSRAYHELQRWLQYPNDQKRAMLSFRR